MTREEFDLVAALTPSETYALLHGRTDHYKALGSQSLRGKSETEAQRALIFDYKRDLSGLGGTAHVIDLGAGAFVHAAEILSLDPNTALNHPRALNGYFDRPLTERPRVTAITLDPTDTGYIRKDALEKTGRAHLFVERKFEEIPENEIIDEFGLADIIIDAVGVFRYSPDLPLVIEKVSRMLKSGGRLYAENTGAKFIVDGKSYNLPEFLELTGLFNRVAIPVSESDVYAMVGTRFTPSQDMVFVRRNTPALTSLSYSIEELELNPSGGNLATYLVKWSK